MTDVKTAIQNELDFFDQDNQNVVNDATEAGLPFNSVIAIADTVDDERELVAEGVESTEEANQRIDEVIGDLTYGDEQTAIGDDVDVQLVG